jgi:hypothetical protein
MIKCNWFTFFPVSSIMGLCLLSPSQAANAQAKPVKGSEQLERVLSWLPADTESISVAQGPFTLTIPPAESWTPQTWDPNRAVTDQQLAVEFESVPLTLFSFDKGSFLKRFEGQRVELAVHSSRHFRAPAGLGMGPFEGCEIVVFADDFDEKNKIISDTRNSALQVEEIQGQQVSIFREKLEEDIWTTYVAFPNSRVVLVASDRAFLAEVLRRMQGGTGKRALPDDLPEWKFIETGSQFWGLRHYDRTQEKLDPTSPLGGRKSASESDDHAIGITFGFDPGHSRSAKVTYLSSDREIAGRANKLLAMSDVNEAKGLNIEVREIAPGVSQGIYSLGRLESTDFFFLALTEMFGPAIYI